MASALVDYIVTAGIKQRLQFLSENPHHLYYILDQLYCNKNIRYIVGDKYIKEAVECIISQKMHVGPAYNIDLDKMPSITVISSGQEDQQYVGDYGFSETQKICPPTIFDRFDASSINKDTLTVSGDYHLDEKLWKGIFIGNGEFVAQLDYMYNSENKTILVLKKEIPVNTSLKGWASLSDDQYRGIIYSASTDFTTTSITLTNSGSYAQHYLYSTILRYVLKSQRMFFDMNGLQVATMSYSVPVINDQVDMIFQSQYTLQGKYTESWIEREFMLPNVGDNYKVCVDVESSNPLNDTVHLLHEEEDDEG